MSSRLLAAAVLLTASTALFAQDDPALLAHYDFIDAGAVLHDSSGHGHHGDIEGGQWVGLDRGGALHFTDDNQYVDMGDPDELAPSDAVTLAAGGVPATA